MPPSGSRFQLRSWPFISSLLLALGVMATVGATPTKHTSGASGGKPAAGGSAPSASGASSSSSSRPPGLIVLLTDFGSRGYLLGSLKGAIYKALPDARIDSLSNDIPKFDIDEAAQTLVLSTADFPAGTVFVAVVDPGIGRPRTPIALETENGQLYLAPDNGVLTQVAVRYHIKRVHEITNRDIIRADPRESTFLSRDVFAPAAAALARGVDLAELGPPLGNIYLLTSRPAQIRDQAVYGTVSLIDGFGNVHTNIREEQLTQLGLKVGDAIEVAIGERHFQVRWVTTYGDVKQGESLALVGSHDEVELAINQGNLAQAMNIQKGEVVVLRHP